MDTGGGGEDRSWCERTLTGRRNCCDQGRSIGGQPKTAGHDQTRTSGSSLDDCEMNFLTGERVEMVDGFLEQAGAEGVAYLSLLATEPTKSAELRIHLD